MLVTASAAAQALGARPAAHQELQARAGYAMAEVRVAGGTAVREYVSPSGTIFGIAWDGPVMPNLSQWLGAHFAAFQAAARGARHRGPLVIHSGNLVVESGGHMRALRGRAYLTDAIPANLSAAVVQ